MEALKKSRKMRKPPATAQAASSEETSDAVAEEPKPKRAPRKAKTA
jgi:hypothetical protein